MQQTEHVDPSALGLFGLAMVTLTASSQKLGLTTGFSGVIPWAVFLGAIAQLMAGILDYKKRNVFGATAFCAYGLFWLGMAASWLEQMGVLGEELAVVDTHQMGVAFVGYLILTAFLTVGAARTNKVLFLIFVFIDLLFIGLAVSNLAEAGALSHFFHRLAALSELAIALLSFYGAGANVLNNQFGETVLSVGAPIWKGGLPAKH